MLRKIDINKIFWIFLIIVSLIIQFVLLKKTSKIEVIFAFNGVLFAVIILLFYTNNLRDILIIFYLLPLLYLNNSVHYQLKYELIFALPLFLTFLYILVIKILNNKKNNRATYLTKPIIIFLLYFCFIGFYGAIQGFNKSYIIFEGYHFLLFGSIIIFNNINSRENYFLLFKVVLVIFFLISLEYIIMGAIISGDRFVTFQSGFLPFLTGITFSLFLFESNNIKKILYFAISFIFILAMISTLTRSLWVVTMLTLGLVYIIYLWSIGRFSLFKKIFVLVFTIVAFLFIVQMIRNTKPTDALSDSENVDERAQSIANPTEDHSFLMRVEMGWYAIQKFVEKPITGGGLGDYLQFKFLGNTKIKNIYIDNSWFYFLWKGGIIGFLIVSVIFFRSIKVGLNISKFTDSIYTKAIVIGILGGTIGIMALGILSPLLIKYRTNVLFPLVWSYLEYEYYLISTSRKLK